MREALFRDARAKCYLCEQVVVQSGFQIDHLQPKGQYPLRTCDWKNLFCSCPKCNNKRKKTWPSGGLLVPDVDDVEGRLRQEIDHDGTVSFSARDPNDSAASNTASELMRLHGSEDPVLRKDIENALLKCLQRAYLLRQELKKLHKEDESWHRKRLELKRLLGRGAPFTALLRSRMQDKLSKKLFD
ncbi:MAG: hypothetical protein MUF64_05515 [Polyangiaceae bacterium]|nr:hypothetical protein [Polyangiaceae bacterium]